MVPPPPTAAAAAAAPAAAPEVSALRKLLHRWFVQYNPFYVASAALVLVGMLAWQAGADGGSAALRVAGVSELFAWSLVFAAALLVRIGQRRSAIMLAFLACLYEWDVGLVTESSVYLGRAGDIAAGLFVASALAKVAALGVALRVRFSRGVFAAVAVSAIGLVAFPRLLAGDGHSLADALLGPFVLVITGLPRGDSITSKLPLDAWGRTVLVRASRSAWTLSFLLVMLHVGFWCSRYALSPVGALAALVCTLVPRIRSERGVALLLTGVFGAAYVAAPEAMSSAATLIAIALGLRVIFPAFTVLGVRIVAATPARAGVPYRAVDAAEPVPELVVLPARLEGAERARALAGMLLATHLAVWTFGFRGYGCFSTSGFPPHLVTLNLALALAVALVAWRMRAPSAALPGLFMLGALAHQIAPRPETPFAWGLTTITTGFALFAVSLVVSYRLRDVAPTSQRPSSAGS